MEPALHYTDSTLTKPAIALNFPTNGSQYLFESVVSLEICDINGTESVLYQWDRGININASAPQVLLLPNATDVHLLRVFPYDNATLLLQNLSFKRRVIQQRQQDQGLNRQHAEFHNLADYRHCGGMIFQCVYGHVQED